MTSKQDHDQAERARTVQNIARYIDEMAAKVGACRETYYQAVREVQEEHSLDATLYRNATWERLQGALAELRLAQDWLREHCPTCADRRQYGIYPVACSPAHGRLLRLD